MKYIFAHVKKNRLLYEQLIGRRTEFLSVISSADGIVADVDAEVDVFIGLQADEKLMLDTTLQLIKDGGMSMSDNLTA